MSLTQKSSKSIKSQPAHVKLSPKTYKFLSVLGSALVFALVAGLQSVLLMYKKAALRLQTLHGVMQNPNAIAVTSAQAKDIIAQVATPAQQAKLQSILAPKQPVLQYQPPRMEEEVKNTNPMVYDSNAIKALIQ